MQSQRRWRCWQHWAKGTRIWRRTNRPRNQTINSPTLNPSEQQHLRLLTVIRESLPDDAIIMGDACQVSYSASFALPVQQPRRWHYAAGYCALGFAFPNAIGANWRSRNLVSSPLPAMADRCSRFRNWSRQLNRNCRYRIFFGTITDTNRSAMTCVTANYPRVAVDGLAPDFTRLAEAMHCRRPDQILQTVGQRHQAGAVVRRANVDHCGRKFRLVMLLNNGEVASGLLHFPPPA